MSNYVAIRNGGATDEQGALRFLRKISANGEGPVRVGDLQVTPHGTPNNSVDVQVGDIVIAYQNYAFYAWSDAINNLTVTANSSGNPRLDAVVAYIDLAVVSSASNNNPTALKFLEVAGTPAGSPAEPSGATIQAAVGAGNPYYILGDVNVPNGFTSGSTVTNSGSTVIVDKRINFIVGSNPKFGFFVADTPAVANDQSWNPIAVQAQTIQGIYAYARTAPVGSSLTIRIWNVTQGVAVGSISITAGSQTANTTSLTNANIAAGDVLRADVTAIGSTTPGSNISVVVY